MMPTPLAISVRIGELLLSMGLSIRRAYSEDMRKPICCFRRASILTLGNWVENIEPAFIRS
jgi:hypothetical protein